VIGGGATGIDAQAARRIDDAIRIRLHGSGIGHEHTDAAPLPACGKRHVADAQLCQHATHRLTARVAHSVPFVEAGDEIARVVQKRLQLFRRQLQSGRGKPCARR
jgi:hypothetical protein